MFLEGNLNKLREDIEKTLERLNKPKDYVKLVGVTKTVDVETIEKAIKLGLEDIGENKVQELVEKIDNIGKKVNYHMIGHLQTNKVKYIIDSVSLIHSLDRISLAKEIDKRAGQKNLIIDVLVQVNIAEEESKFGLKVEDVIPFIEEVSKYKNIRIKGLMTLAPYTDDEDLLRKVFRTMTSLKDKVADIKIVNVEMEYLSMGMSNDYKIAIEEGANLIRVGSRIFGDRNY